MAQEVTMKRFTDTGLWDKEWFMNLSPVEKVAWFYIKDKCDNVGVWSPNFGLADFVIGDKIDWDKLIENTNGNIEVMDNGKWWLVDFCAFQHPDLDSESKSAPIKSYIALLKKHSLWEAYTKAINSLQGKGKGTGRGKGKGTGEGTEAKSSKQSFGEYVKMTEEEHGKLVAQYGASKTKEMIAVLDNYKGSKGQTYKSDYRAILSWVVGKCEAVKIATYVPMVKEKAAEEFHDELGDGLKELRKKVR